MRGLLKIYSIYIFSTIVLLAWRLKTGRFFTSDYRAMAFLVVFIYFFLVNWILYILLKSEDKETKSRKFMADQNKHRCLHENIWSQNKYNKFQTMFEMTLYLFHNYVIKNNIREILKFFLLFDAVMIIFYFSAWSLSHWNIK